MAGLVDTDTYLVNNCSGRGDNVGAFEQSKTVGGLEKIVDGGNLEIRVGQAGGSVTISQ